MEADLAGALDGVWCWEGWLIHIMLIRIIPTMIGLLSLLSSRRQICICSLLRSSR